MRYEKFIRLEQKKKSIQDKKNSSGINYDKNNSNDNNGNNDNDKINNIKILAKLMILITSIFLKINEVLFSSIF